MSFFYLFITIDEKLTNLNMKTCSLKSPTKKGFLTKLIKNKIFTQIICSSSHCTTVMEDG